MFDSFDTDTLWGLIFVIEVFKWKLTLKTFAPVHKIVILKERMHIWPWESDLILYFEIHPRARNSPFVGIC